jgi:hypothetical protein
MLNRRNFVAGSAALATLGTLPFAYARPVRGATATPPGVPSLVVVDGAVPQAAAFAAEARAAGYATHVFDRDVGALWMNEIEPRLRAGPVVLAGLTGAATLFCVELLARDYGAHLVQRESAGATGVRWLVATQPGRRAPLAPPTRPRT